MRILVISDTHGKISALKNILEKHDDITEVFFLGDLVRDIEAAKDAFPNKNFHIVSGNCDAFSFYNSTDIALIGGVKILFTHGHHFGVKGGIERLCEAARQRGCLLALFGHTHRAVTIYDNGLYIVNPGSLGHSREGSNSYAIIDLQKNAVVTSVMKAD